MRKVIVQHDDKVEFFKHVTKVQCFCTGSIADAYVVIYQGNKKTKRKMCEINGFEVIEN